MLYRIIPFILLFTSLKMTADPLKGIYTVGPVNCDFSSLQNAITAIQSQGISDTVIIKIKNSGPPGEIEIKGSIIGISKAHPVIFESFSGDPETVVLQSTGSLSLYTAHTLYLYEQSHLIFRNLTIKNLRDKAYSWAVDMIYSSDITFEGCILGQFGAEPTTIDYEAAIQIKTTPNQPLPEGIKIINCQIIGTGSGVTIGNYDDPVTISNCQFINTGRYSLSTKWCDEIIVRDNLLSGEVDNGWTNSILFTGNQVLGECNAGSGEFQDNVFFAEAALTGSKSINNVFMHSCNCEVTNQTRNVFNNAMHASYINGVSFKYNTCFGKVSFSFCNNISWLSNIFYQSASTGFCDNSSFVNNFFFGEMRLGISDEAKVYHNTFAMGARLRSGSEQAIIKNNSFSEEIYFENAPLAVEYNNYYPTGGYYDTHPFTIPPDYIDSTSLYARNPLLYGKGLYLGIFRDIDEKIRPNPPTLGANEICLEADTLRITCGEKIPIVLCNLPANGKYLWSPVQHLDNPNARFPTATVLDDETYFVFDSVSNYRDTVVILSEKIDHFLIDTSLHLLCGQAATLSTLSHSQANWKWIPSEAFSSDTIRNPIIQPAVSDTFYLVMSVPGCPDYIDSVYVEVDPLPRAYASYDNTDAEFHFINNSYCADTYYWDFGDGTSSTDFEPVHIYDTSGVLHIFLIAFNAAGSDTLFGVILVPEITSITDISAEPGLVICPNPATSFIEMKLSGTDGDHAKKLELINSQGKLVRQVTSPEFVSHAYEMNVNDLLNGIYFLRIFFENKTVVQKIIIQKR